MTLQISLTFEESQNRLDPDFLGRYVHMCYFTLYVGVFMIGCVYIIHV